MSTTTRTLAPITPRQLSWLQTLVVERDTTGLVTEALDRFTARQAHTLIDTLLARPRVAVLAPTTGALFDVAPDADIPAGYYAVSVPGDTQAVAFFQLDRPTEGRWAGRTFLSQLASDERYSVRGARRDVVMALIAEDIHEAGFRFGREIGRCCRCHRTLTDESSRAAGIGPDCAGRF
jgi:hypothetical protein